MARKGNTSAKTARVNITPTRIDELAKELVKSGKDELMLWDETQKGLGVRARKGREPAFIYAFRLDGKFRKLPLGACSALTIESARKLARNYAEQVAEGDDPQEKKEAKAQERADKEAKKAQDALTFKELWEDYVSQHQTEWSAGHLRDHHAVMREPGLPNPRSSKKMTIAGPLWALANERVVDIPSKLEPWLKKEKLTRPTLARKAYVLLKTCLSWHGVELNAVLDGKDRKRLKKAIPKVKTKDDVLEAAMLQAWWREIDKLPFVSGTYLKCLLLVGCRRNELSGLRWSDVDLKWNRLTLKDKVEGTRVVPLTSYVRHLILDLKARGEVVDLEREAGRLKRSRTLGVPIDAGKGDTDLVFRGIRGHGGTECIEKPHAKACQAAGLPHITQHGLRRSFITLAEEAEVPSGATAQICGHKPSALVERSYKRRSIDTLAGYHQRIEDHLLTNASVEKPTTEAPRSTAPKVVK